MRIKILLATCFIISSLINCFAQPPVDGYSKGKGNATIVGSISNEKSKKYYAANGLTPASLNIRSYTLFGVVGITDKFDAQISIPFVISGPESNFQDISLFLKYALLKKGKTTILGSFGQSSPLTNYKTSGGSAIGQKASRLDARLIIQQDLGSGFFIMAQSGYTKRSFPTPSSVPAAIKFGYGSSKIYTDIWFDYQYSFGGSDYLDGTNRAFTTLGVGYSKIGGQVYKPFNKHIGVSLGGSYVLDGRNIGKATTLSLAIIYNL